MSQTILVCGAGGFIGSHLVRKLKIQGAWVRGVDLKNPLFSPSPADDFIIGDLRDPQLCQKVLDRDFDEVYQLAADMGGAGYIFTGDNDAAIMHNSALINLNMLHFGQQAGIKKIFYSSSACIYPEHNQLDPYHPTTAENSAYPAAPDSEYGWEKLFSERLYLSFHRNYELPVRKAVGTMGKKRPRPPSAGKSLKPRITVRSRCGETGSRPVLFFTSTNACWGWST